MGKYDIMKNLLLDSLEGDARKLKKDKDFV